MRNNQVKKLVILAFITALSVVLGNFLKEEIPSVADSIERCADAIECLMKDGIELAMTRYNG